MIIILEHGLRSQFFPRGVDDLLAYLLEAACIRVYTRIYSHVRDLRFPFAMTQANKSVALLQNLLGEYIYLFCHNILPDSTWVLDWATSLSLTVFAFRNTLLFRVSIEWYIVCCNRRKCALPFAENKYLIKRIIATKSGINGSNNVSLVGWQTLMALLRVLTLKLYSASFWQSQLYT